MGHRMILLAAALLVALLGTACGAANSNGVNADMRAQWERNRIQHRTEARIAQANRANASLTSGVTAGMPVMNGAAGMATSGAVLPPGVNGMMPFGIVPRLPPPNVVQLHRPIPGCTEPNGILFHNQSPYYVQLNVDGIALQVYGPQGLMGVPQNGTVLSVIPPNTRVYGCLQHIGTVHVTGMAYNNLGGVLTPVCGFDFQRRFSLSTLWGQRNLQHLPFTKKTLRWNAAY